MALSGYATALSPPEYCYYRCLFFSLSALVGDGGSEETVVQCGRDDRASGNGLVILSGRAESWRPAEPCPSGTRQDGDETRQPIVGVSERLSELISSLSLSAAAGPTTAVVALSRSSKPPSGSKQLPAAAVVSRPMG